MDASIVIVSWRVKAQLRACLNSIFDKTQDLEFEVFVVDNNSDDGTVSMIKGEFPQVQCMANSENVGFAKACNQAIKKSKGKYILLLNPDTILTENSVRESVTFVNATTDAGIVGCRIENYDGSLQPSVRRFPDFLSHLILLLKIHNIFPTFSALRRYYFHDFDYSKTQSVDQVMGAYFMIRREVLKTIGLLDENFFIWYEEVDLCKRLIGSEWKTYYFSGTQIQHQKAASFSQQKAITKQLIFNRSLLYYFFKHKSIPSYFGLLLIYPISMFLAVGVQLFRFKKTDKTL